MIDPSKYEADPHRQKFILAKRKKDDFIEFTKEDAQQSIPKRFEGQVSKYPHYIAVKTSGYELTYGELNKSANSVAHAITALRRALAETLPDYMVPAAFMILDVMPTNPNGKIDRQALPEPGTARPQLEAAFVAPGTPIEEMLVDIWSQVLGLDEVSIHDDFLELGGNSLLATQIISRVVKAFQAKLTMRSLLQSPTVSNMAVIIVQKQAEKETYYV